MFSAKEGIFQGECLSTAVFCIFLPDVLDRFIAKLAAKGITNPQKCITILAYVDDLVLAMEQNLFATVWPIFIAALAESNLVVETTKCKAWIHLQSSLSCHCQLALMN